MPWVTDIHPSTEELNACVQCGLCLPVCPTFRLTGRETASPRGRLHAMSAVHEGVVQVDEAFASIIDFCLGCRACEPVCPGLVPYGRALEGARAEIVEQVPGRGNQRRWLLGSALGSRRIMRTGGNLLSAAQKMGLTRFAPGAMRTLANGLRRLADRPAPTLGHVGGSGDAGTVALLAGCIQDEWFRPVNTAAVSLLERAGYRVEVPVAQTCCGALAAHDGREIEARRLAERNVEVFESADVVVATAAGCSAHLAGYEHWDDRGDAIASKVRDITVVIADAIEKGSLPTAERDRGRIAIQDPCHLRHAQRVVDEPREILAAAGYEVVEIDDLALCCGAAGIYTLLQPTASSQLGNQKADQVRSTGVTSVASANPGCEMQLRSHLGAEYVISHPIEWYLRAIEEESVPGLIQE